MIVAYLEILVSQGPLDPLVHKEVRKERKENLARLERGENLAKMVNQVFLDIRVIKETKGLLVCLDEMVLEVRKVIKGHLDLPPTGVISSQV